MFIAALFTRARTREQPKCPPTDEWIKMWYRYTMECSSATKKNKTVPFAATWTDLQSVILREISQTDKEEYLTASLICRT